MSLQAMMARNGIHVPKVLLPKIGMEKMNDFLTIACDIYTSDHAYWNKLYEERKGMFSSLHFILPEVYLPKLSGAQELTPEDWTAMEMIRNFAIPSIVSNMKRSVDQKMFAEEEAMVYIERRLTDGTTRKGLLLCLELDKYSFEKGAQTLIRPTEQTIPSRIPPRILIRKEAIIEIPHILVLIDNPERTVIEPLAASKDKMKTLYDFDFAIRGNKSHMAGYGVQGPVLEQVVKAFDALADAEFQKKKYGLTGDQKPVLFCMGDGNHSFATAWRHWQNLKAQYKAAGREAELKDHPAQYCMVEIINLFDQSIEKFEPIHRIVENIEPTEVLEFAKKYFAKEGVEVDVMDHTKENDKKVHDKAAELKGKGHFFPMFSKGKTGYLYLAHPTNVLEVGSIQNLLDAFLNEKKMKLDNIDFLHGLEEVLTKCSHDGVIGFLLPELNKEKLFKSILCNGVTPRKTFSIGHSHDKRCYLETRLIV